MKRRDFMSKAAASAALGASLSYPLISNAVTLNTQPNIKAICFDGFPIFNPKPIFGLVTKLYPEHGKTFSQTWFNKIFAYTWLRTNGNRYKNFYAIIEDALTYTANKLKVELTADSRDQLMGIWLQLKPWPDVSAALKTFEEQGIRLAFLSNLTDEMLRTNTKNAGIHDAFEYYLTTDKVSAFKPSPVAYQIGVDAFKLPKENIAFAAFGAWDAVGASWFGYPTVWVNRFGSPAENLDAGAITTGRDITALTNFVRPIGRG